MAHYPVKID